MERSPLGMPKGFVLAAYFMGLVYCWRVSRLALALGARGACSAQDHCRGGPLHPPPSPPTHFSQVMFFFSLPPLSQVVSLPSSPGSPGFTTCPILLAGALGMAWHGPSSRDLRWLRGHCWRSLDKAPIPRCARCPSPVDVEQYEASGGAQAAAKGK